MKSTGLTREQQEENRTNTLLEVAAQVFLEQGFEAASTTEISRRARASKQTYYSRFPSKRALFLAVIEFRTARLPEIYRAVFNNQGPLRETLVAAGETLIAMVLSPEMISLSRTIYMEAQRFPEAARYYVERGPDRGIAFFADFFAEQARLGRLQISDSNLAAKHFGGLVLSDSLHRTLLGVHPDTSKKSRKQQIESGVDAFLKIYAR